MRQHGLPQPNNVQELHERVRRREHSETQERLKAQDKTLERMDQKLDEEVEFQDNTKSETQQIKEALVRGFDELVETMRGLDEPVEPMRGFDEPVETMRGFDEPVETMTTKRALSASKDSNISENGEETETLSKESLVRGFDELVETMRGLNGLVQTMTTKRVLSASKDSDISENGEEHDSVLESLSSVNKTMSKP